MRTDQLSVTTSHAGVDTSVSHTSTSSTSHQHENEIHFVSETNLDDVATDPIMSTTYSSTSKIPVLRDNTVPTIAGAYAVFPKSDFVCVKWMHVL